MNLQVNIITDEKDVICINLTEEQEKQILSVLFNKKPDKVIPIPYPYYNPCYPKPPLCDPLITTQKTYCMDNTIT